MTTRIAVFTGTRLPARLYAQAMARLIASHAGYEVIVMDDQPEQKAIDWLREDMNRTLKRMIVPSGHRGSIQMQPFDQALLDSMGCVPGKAKATRQARRKHRESMQAMQPAYTRMMKPCVR